MNSDMQKDLTTQKTELETSRQCAVFHVREDGREEYFRVDQNLELLEAALTLQRYLWQEPGIDADSFADLFPDREIISPEEFDSMILLRMENTGKVTGAFDLDFDKQEFSAVHIMDGWMTFAMVDIPVAAYHAFFEAGLSTDERYSILLDELGGRELRSPGHLSAKEISFSEQICLANDLLVFHMEPGFNENALFGSYVCPGDTVNVYANYDCSSGQVCDELEADLCREDGSMASLCYRLNAAEKEILLRKMQNRCQEQTGKTLADYSTQLMAEHTVPLTQPVM